MKKSKIILDISLDENNHPEKIEWTSTDGENANKPLECKAMLLSLFDKDYKDTYKIDLWTNELQVVEMNKFMFQSLRSLADTYYKSTQNVELSNAFMSFVEYFGEESEVITKNEN